MSGAIATTGRPTSRPRTPSPTAEIRPAQGRAAELLARGRIAYQNGAYPAAADLFDEAIGVDPHLDEAWLMKSNRSNTVVMP